MPAHVRLHRVAATRQGERDIAGRGLLAGEQLMGGLEEASLVLRFWREAERELGVGAREATMDVQVAGLDGGGAAVLGCDRAGEHRDVWWLISPLVDIYVWLIEPRVFRIRGHEQGATFVSFRVGHRYLLFSPAVTGARAPSSSAMLAR